MNSDLTWWLGLLKNVSHIHQPRKRYGLFGPLVYEAGHLYSNLQTLALLHFHIGGNDTNLGLRLLIDYATKIGITNANLVDRFDEFNRPDWIVLSEYGNYFDGISPIPPHTPNDTLFDCDEIIWPGNELHEQITKFCLIATTTSVCNQTFAKGLLRDVALREGGNALSLDGDTRTITTALFKFFNDNDPGWENREIPDDLVTVVSKNQA